MRYSDQGLSSFEPSQGADEVDAREEVSSSLFVARCDGAKVLDDVEETVDEVALAIERKVALAPASCDLPLAE